MSWRATKRRLALAVCALALLGGGTAAAIAATGSPSASHARHSRSGPHGVLAAAAAYLGVSTDQLRGDLRAGKSLGAIANATPGHSEAGLIAAVLAARKGRLQALQARLPQRIAALVAQTGRHRKTRPHPVRQAVLSYLELNAKQLQAKLRGGKTLAQLADSTGGKSSAGLASVIASARRARIAQAISSGSMSSHEGATRTAKLPARVHAMLGHSRASGASSAH